MSNIEAGMYFLMKSLAAAVLLAVFKSAGNWRILARMPMSALYKLKSIASGNSSLFSMPYDFEINFFHLTN